MRDPLLLHRKQWDRKWRLELRDDQEHLREHYRLKKRLMTGSRRR